MPESQLTEGLCLCVVGGWDRGRNNLSARGASELRFRNCALGCGQMICLSYLVQRFCIDLGIKNVLLLCRAEFFSFRMARIRDFDF